MAETDQFPLDADYVVPDVWTEGVIRSFSDSRRQFARLKSAPQRFWNLEFRSRPTSEKDQVISFYRRLEKSYFRWAHKVYSILSGAYVIRYFPVEFAGPPATELVANNCWDLRVVLVEAVGRPLPAAMYPDPTAGHPSVFQEETELTKTQGTWTQQSQGNAHGGAEKTNANTNTTDYALWVYAGYGFRLWARKANNLGILQLFLDDVSLGNVDLYAATAQAAAAIHSKLDVPLGLHRVKIKATNTRNGSSSANTIIADALEYLI